jgi:CDP-diacylglycerol--glycerol-3-phosphate 3-phosphatidyltransferase
VNVPNTLSLIRIGIVPVFIVIFYIKAPWTNEVLTILFVAAGLTDWLDGYLARRLRQTSAFGAFLDPVADKLVVVAALILLVQADPAPIVQFIQVDPRPIVAVAAVIITGREIAVSALREWMAMLGQRGVVRVASLGKVKTAVQMIAIALLLYKDPVFGLPIYELGLVCLFAAAILTLWSMVIYLKAAWPMMSMDVPDGQRDERQRNDR